MPCRCATKEEHAQRAMDQMRESQQSNDAERQRENAAASARIAELQVRSPDPDRFAIDDIEQVGAHLVVKVEYPGCAKCSYEGRKVMVFLNTTIKHAIKWRRIDPHFRDVTKSTLPAGQTEAPSPACRFPASQDGWADAMAYARGKVTR